MTGVVYCERHASYFDALKNPGSFSSCPQCGFKYSKAYSKFAQRVVAKCPNCGTPLEALPPSEFPLDLDVLRVVRSWMQASPSCRREVMVKLFDEYGETWDVAWMEGSNDEVYDLFHKCVMNDGGGHTLESNIYGIAGVPNLGDVRADPPPPWWGERIGVAKGSVIQVIFGRYHHVLGRIGEDRFLFLVHVGPIAEEVRKRPGATTPIESSSSNLPAGWVIRDLSGATTPKSSSPKQPRATTPKSSSPKQPGKKISQRSQPMSQQATRDGSTSTTEAVLGVLRGYQARKTLYFAPNIPSHKLTNASSRCNIPSDEQVLALIDCTVFGSAKDCILFGTKGLYYYHLGATPKMGMIPWSDFPSCNFVKGHGVVKIRVMGMGLEMCASGSYFSAEELCLMLESLRLILTK